MSTTYVLSPNSGTAGGWSVVPGGSGIATVLSDGSDATYVARSHTFGSPAPGDLILGFPNTVVLGPHSVVARVRGKLRAANHPGASPPGSIVIDIYGTDPEPAADVAGFRSELGADVVTPTDSWGTACYLTDFATPVTQADLDAIGVHVQMPPRIGAGTSVVHAHEVVLEVVVVDPGVVTVSAPVGTHITPAPAITFAYADADTEGIVEWVDVAVCTAATAGAFDPYAWTGVAEQAFTLPWSAVAETGLVPLSPLPQGVSYVAFVKVRKRVSCYVGDVSVLDQWVPAVGTTEFTIAPSGFGGMPLGFVPEGAERRLGCGAWEAYVTERGSDVLAGRIPLASVSGPLRTINETAQMRIVVPTDRVRVECPSLVREVDSWSHEIHLYRDGEEAFVGVPGAMTFDATSITVPLYDLSCWFGVRLVPVTREMVGVDLAQMWLVAALDTLALDNSMGLQVSAFPCGVLGDRMIYADQGYVAPVLSDLQAAGVDVVTIGRRMVGGGLEVPVGPLGLLRDEHMADASTGDTLSSRASRWVLTGQGGGAQSPPLIGASESVPGGIDPSIGLVERIEQIADARSVGELTIAAAARIAMSRGRVVIPRPSLRPSAPVVLAELVPGALVDLDLREPLFPAVGTYRLERVDVQASASRGGWTESLSIAVQPVGTS